MKEALDHPEISLVIPVYNEEESVKLLHQEIVSVLQEIGRSYEIIFVDDGSTDGTGEVLGGLVPATVIIFARNFGKSQALQAGFDEARGDYIVTLDGDLQDDPREIPRMLARAEQGIDLVCGWKRKRRDPFSKRFVSKVANGVTRMLTGTHVHDMNCGFKVYRKEFAKSIQFFGDMHRYIPAVAAVKGFSVDELEVEHRKRAFGNSKYGIARLVSGLFDFITLLFLRKFTDRPMHFFGGIGFILEVLGLGILAYLSLLKVVQGAAIGDRPLLLFGVLLAIVGLQLLSLGLLGELIIRQKTDTRMFAIREIIRT
ncbi:MAG: glycosyltransferase family 2 protein [bacterium]|nr:glycosyltransferase family 2 protein [bacterium]